MVEDLVEKLGIAPFELEKETKGLTNGQIAQLISILHATKESSVPWVRYSKNCFDDAMKRAIEEVPLPDHEDEGEMTVVKEEESEDLKIKVEM